MHGPKPYILIIGGGIGGLCLAQALKKARIPFAVFERDESARFRNQGYRIHINENGHKAIHHALPANLYELFVGTSSRPQTGRYTMLDSDLREVYSRSLEHYPSPPSLFFRLIVHRLTLREILLSGLEGAVEFNKHFSHYEQLPHGKVRAYFTDGSFCEGDLLVGADGTRSKVRELLLPHAAVSEVAFGIYGKTSLVPGHTDWIPEKLVNGPWHVIGPSGIVLGGGNFKKRKDFAGDHKRYASDAQLTQPDDFIRWTLSAQLGQLGFNREQFQDADPAALHARISTIISDWHPMIRRLVAEAEIPATFQVIIRSSEPVEPWQTTTVTVLGDAIHSMVSGRGTGANTALRDAELLSKKLEEAASGEKTLLDAVGEYEREMLEYGFKEVAEALAYGRRQISFFVR